jgi:Homeodomain-like domain
MRGPKPTPCTFPDDFLQEARNAIRRRTIAVRDAQRFHLVRLLHERPALTHDDAARCVGLSARQVQRWRQRWAAGTFDIRDRSGRGRKAAFSPVGPRLGQGPRLPERRRVG